VERAADPSTYPQNPSLNPWSDCPNFVFRTCVARPAPSFNIAAAQLLGHGGLGWRPPPGTSGLPSRRRREVRAPGACEANLPALLDGSGFCWHCSARWDPNPRKLHALGNAISASPMGKRKMPCLPRSWGWPLRRNRGIVAHGGNKTASELGTAMAKTFGDRRLGSVFHVCNGRLGSASESLLIPSA